MAKKGSLRSGSRWFSHSLRVRYQETDQMGVVYHANYLNWFEIGRTELIREAGMPYRSIEPRGLLLPVIDLDMKFVQPARYDDRITIYTRLTEFNHLRMHFEYEIRKITEMEVSEQEEHAAQMPHPSPLLPDPTGELLVTGSTRHVWVNKSFRPVRVDKEAPDVHQLIRKLVDFPEEE